MNTPNLSDLTVKDLRSLASKHKIPGRTRMKKTELVAALSSKLTAAKPPLVVPTHSVGSSSSLNAEHSSPSAADAVTQDPEPGLPIPDHYSQDRLVLLAQDPHHIFAYWELADGGQQEAWASAGPNAQPVLILLSDNGSEQRQIDLTGGNYYLSVSANMSYRAQLALRSADGRLIILMESNQVRTPAVAPSDRVDEAWMSTNDSFEQLVIQAGLPGGIGSSATIADQRLRSRMWHALVAGPQGANSDLPSSHSSSSLGRR